MCAHKGSIETLDYLIASGADFNIADRWVLVLFQMCNFVVSVALVESTSVSYFPHQRWIIVYQCLPI
jgi:hypothetical protein